jgi:hypothetical protein
MWAKLIDRLLFVLASQPVRSKILAIGYRSSALLGGATSILAQVSGELCGQQVPSEKEARMPSRRTRPCDGADRPALGACRLNPHRGLRRVGKLLSGSRRGASVPRSQPEERGELMTDSQLSNFTLPW